MSDEILETNDQRLYREIIGLVDVINRLDELYRRIVGTTPDDGKTGIGDAPSLSHILGNGPLWIRSYKDEMFHKIELIERQLYNSGDDGE